VAKPRYYHAAKTHLGELNVSATETQGTALITGASGGIGTIDADRLARRGYGLIVIVCNRRRLAALARRLKDQLDRIQP
jgi:uncharacterized protein